MRLTNPAALWFLFALAIPPLLARWRTPRSRQMVSNLYLWRDRIRPAAASLTVRRLRRDRLVALQMALMAAIVLALAGPVVISRLARVAFVFDVSMSMGAREGITTRLDAARSRAREVLASLPSRAVVRLIAAGASPRDLGEFPAGAASLNRAMDAVEPTAGPADLPAALRLATVGGAAVERTWVFSDSPDNEAAQLAAGTNPAVNWEPVGHAGDNLALARVAVRRDSVSPARGQVLVSVANHGTRARDADLEIVQDGLIVVRQAVRIPAQSTETALIAIPQLGQLISARLLSDDALALDNLRLAVVPSIDRVRVRLITPGQFFLERVLEANPRIMVETQSPPPARAAGTPAQGAEDPPPDVVICDGCAAPPDQDAPTLVIAPIAGPKAPVAVTVARPDHPLAASLDFGEPLVATPSNQTADVTGEVILRAGGLPVAIADERDGRRTVELRLDVGAPGLALSTSFPILIANAIDWLAAGDDNPRELVAGEPVNWRLPRAFESAQVSIAGPGSRPVGAHVQGRYVTITDTSAIGLYRVKTPDGEQQFVVNPAVDTESALVAGGAASTSGGAPTHAQPASDQRHLAPVLLLLAAGLVAVEWLYRRTRSHGRKGQTVWRIVVAACLIVGAIGPSVSTPEAPLTAMAVLDVSASVPPLDQRRALARVNALAATKRPHDRLGLVVFGLTAALELRPAERVSVSALRSDVADTGSNLAGGIALAQAALPRDGVRRIVVMSDGRETQGRAERAAAYAGAAGIPIDVVVPDRPGQRPRPIVTRVVAPADVRVGEPFYVSAEVEGIPGVSGRVSLYRDGQLFASPDFHVSADGTAGVTVTDRHQQAGVHTYRAQIHVASDEGFDAEAEDAGSGAVVSVEGERTVLYVAGSGGQLLQQLSDGGFRATPMDPESLPTTAGGLAPFDLLVLDDVPSERMTSSQMTAIVDHVSDAGGGLLVLGSSRTLDAGGYPTGPLGPILPVDVRPRRGRRAPSLGLVLVFDKSGSMADLAGGTPKIELARQAVMRVLGVLPPTDLLGLIAFDARPVAIAPLAPVGDMAPRDVGDRLKATEPGGTTVIAPAAELAVQWLRGAAGATLASRRVLLISDGRTSQADADRLRAAVRGGGIQWSAVAIGADADRPLLRELAESSGGRVYFPDDARELPAIVAREAARAAAGAAVTERFALRAADHPALAGIDRGSLPRMDGYVVGAPRSSAASILVSHLDDPILAVWQAGLGRVGVFTADLGSPWSSALRAWGGAPRLWVQTARWLSRPATEPALRVSVRELDGVARLIVDAERRDGGFLNLSAITAVIRSPQGDRQDVVPVASAPGRYEATLSTSISGPYVVSVSGRDRADGAELRSVRGFYWSADRERRVLDADVTLMTRLADMTGGRVLGPADSPFTGPRPPARTPVWPWLAGAALVTFVLGLVIEQAVVRRRPRGTPTPTPA